MLHPIFVILAVAFNVIGCTSYIIEIVKGRVKPNRVSLFLWALAPLIAFAAQRTEGVGISSLMTFMVGFLPLIVFLSSFFNQKAYWQITRLDIGCGLLSPAALVLWAMTRTGNIAIALSIAADGLAAAPTVIKAWKQPETEDYRVYLCATVSSVITLLTISSWKFASWGFPTYIFLLGVLLSTLMVFPGFRPFARP